MLLIYSTTFDTTVDMLIYHMNESDVFRFNSDCFEKYKIILNDMVLRFKTRLAELQIIKI